MPSAMQLLNFVFMMQSRYPKLLSPLKVGPVTFRNRLFTAPIALWALQGNEPYPTEAVITHFANKARGGASCVTVSGVNLFPVGGDNRIGYDVYQKPHVHYLAQLADRIHFFGARASMELGAVGVVQRPYGVSDGAPSITGKLVKEMPESEMEAQANAFAHCAEVLKKAGFDMVLLHFGHGLTIGQFLSPLTNRRRDRYGGSLKNRARFPSLIIDRIRERIGSELLIEVRISGSEFEPGGIRVEEAIEYVRMIQERIDFIHVSAGIHNPKWMTTTHPSGFLPPMPNVFLAEAVKQAGIEVPVVAIGGIQELDGAEKVIADGRADVVSIARGFIADPDLGEKARRGRGKDVVPCIKCMRCHDSVCYEYHYVCSVNPAIGFEHRLPDLVRPAEEKQRVVVVGGGPAGMQAALVAAERGHRVILYEKSDALGGVLKISDYVSFKYDLRRYKDYLVRRIRKSDVQLKLNTEVTEATLMEERADVIIAALGAEPVVPSIPGMDSEHVFQALHCYGREGSLGKKVAVIGGGQVGCETALHLSQMGIKVTIVELQAELAPQASSTHRTELRIRIAEDANIDCLSRIRCTAIGKKDIICEDHAGAIQTLPAHSVVLATGMRAKTKVVDGLRPLAGKLFAVGDCVHPATVQEAVSSAFYAALQI